MFNFSIRYIKKSLKSKALVILVSLTLVPLLALSVVINKTTNRILNEKIHYLNDQTVNNLALYLTANLQSMLDLTMYYSKNYNIKKDLMNSPKSQEEKEANYYSIYQEINKKEFVNRMYPFHTIAISQTGYIYSSFTYYPNDTVRDKWDQIKKLSWYVNLSTSYSETMTVFKAPHLLFPDGAEQIYIASNVISDFDNVGAFVLGIDKLFFTKLLDNARISERSSLFILDASGECLVEGAKNYISFKELPKTFVQNLDTSTLTQRSKVLRSDTLTIHKKLILKGMDNEFQLVMLAPISDIDKEKVYFNYIMGILVILCVIAMILLAYLMTHGVINPILKLNELMLKVRGGNLNVKVSEHREDEIGQLGTGFNQMIVDIDNYIKDIRLKEEAKRELEVAMLQSQIKPHFVRNTLNIIRWMAELKGASGISKAILSFSNLLEYNFQDAGTLTTVRDEIKYVMEYIFLQKLRYQNKFTSEIHVDEEIMDYHILKLSFQPIVENSIGHGLAIKQDRGKLKIKGYKDKNKLIFIIEDDGVGMDQETLNNLLKLNENIYNKDTGNRIALSNVLQRIQMNFGDEFGIWIESEIGIGTKVRMEFPILQEGRVEEIDENTDC